MKRRERKALELLYPTLEQTARAMVPEEACGLIEWDGNVMTLRECLNVAADPTTSFLIDPSEQAWQLHEIDRRRTEFWGIYHSHPPPHGAAPSPRDKAFAAQLTVNWVIIGLGKGWQLLDGVEDRGDFEIFVGQP